MKCQVCLLPPVGACTAISRHSRNNSGSTGREKSSRLRTERVVVSSSSGVRLNKVILFFSCIFYCDTRVEAVPAPILYVRSPVILRFAQNLHAARDSSLRSE